MEIIGHQKQWNFLKKAAELNLLSHAYLFTGQEKIGKKTFAFEFASHLLQQDVGKRQHPDFIFIEPEKKEIQIGQIRECIWKFSLKPFLFSFKVAIIDQAHCMNQESQNSLLKTLEEPRGKAVLILITEYPEALLPTILSRCEIVKFFPLGKKEIKNYLETQKLSKKEFEEITNYCRGKPGLLIDFIRQPGKLKNQRRIREDLVKVINSPIAFRFQYANNLSQDLQLMKETLDIWLEYYRERFLARINQGSANDFSNGVSLSVFKKNLWLIQSTISLIATTNINTKLALENLIMEL